MSILPTGVSFRVGSQLYPEVEDLVTSTETPGGLKECRFSLPSGLGSTIRWDDRLVIYDSTYDKYPFVGRISNVHKTGICFDFVATRSTRLQVMESTSGPGNPSHPSGVYAGRIYRAGTQMVQALQDALQLCEAVFDGGINPLSGLQFVADTSNMAGYTPEQMWDYVSSLLTGFSTPLLWHVRGRNGEQVVVIDFQDPSARYIVELDEDDIDETYDSEQVITRAAVEWGNDQVYGQALSSLVGSGRQLIHNKYVNGSRDLTRLADAQGLSGTYLARFGQFASSSTTLTMDCDKDTVRVVPPLVTNPVDNWPLHLVESGHGITLLNRSASLYPYNEGLKYIIGTEYDWTQGKLTARCGVAGGGLDSRIQATVDYNVNRLFFGPYNGPPGGNHPLADADLLPQVGPEVRAGEPGEPPVTAYGIAAFRAGQDALGGDPNVPYGRQVDPDLIADEGIEINYAFDVTTAGWKGGTWSIPGQLQYIKYSLWNTTGIVVDTVIFQIYTYKTGDVLPIQLGSPITVSNLRSGQVTVTPTVALPARNTQLVFVVLSPATQAEIINVSLHGKKLFPALKAQS